MHNKTQTVYPILCVILLSLMSGCGQPDDRIPEIPEIPLEGLEQPVSEHLLSELDNVRADSGSAVANGRLAMALHTYRLHETADVVYQRARRISPNAFEWHYLHGVVLQSMSRNEDAIEAYRAAEKVRSGYLPLRQRIADLMVSNGNLDTGRKIYQQLIASKPDLATAHFGLGKVHALQSELGEAVLEYRKAIDVKPSYGAAHYALAEVLREQGDTEGVSYHLGLFEQYKGSNVEIDDPIMTQVRALSRTEQGLTTTALRYLQQRNPSKAAQAFEQVLGAYPDNYSAHVNLVGLYGDLREPENSMLHFEAARVLRPDDPTLYNNLGIARVRNNQLKLAVEAFAEAVRLNPDYARAWTNLGKTQQDLGNNIQALESYRKSVNLNARDRQAQYFYGNLLIATGSPALAVAPLTAALEPKDEKTPHYMRLLAAAQADSGDPGSAVTTLRKARVLAQNTRQTDLVADIDSDLEKLGDESAGAP